MSYTGQTCNGMMKRWKGHVSSAGKLELYFANAIKKYGHMAFDHSLLAQCYDQEDADNLEDFFIENLQTLSPNGYNLRRGGATGRPSQETRQKISEARNKQPPPSEETRRKASKAALKRFEDPEEHHRISELTKAAMARPEIKAKAQVSQKKRWKDPETRHKESELQKKRYEDPQERRKASERANKPETLTKNRTAAKKRYENPEERRKTGEAVKKAIKKRKELTA
jgi:hypothetical protein